MARKPSAKLIRADQGDGGDYLGMCETMRGLLAEADGADAIRRAIGDMPDDYVVELRDILVVSLEALLEEK